MKVVGPLGNPFVATSLELVALDTQNVLEESVVASAYVPRGSRKVQLLRLSSGASYLTAHVIDFWPSD